MNGLSCIVANCGVLHAMTPPPDGKNFKTYAEYVGAKEAWDRTQCWRAYVPCDAQQHLHPAPSPTGL